MLRLGILLLLFDVYLTWARIEKASSTSQSSAPPPINAPMFSTQPLVLQYLFFLLLCFLSTLAFHLPIRLICGHPPNVIRNARWQLVPRYTHENAISTALLVSSCTKLFPLVLIVWEYDLPSSASAVSWAVIVNNIAALEILMDCGYIRASLLVAMGAAARSLVSWGMLGLVGLRGGTEVEAALKWAVDVGAEGVSWMSSL